MKKILLILLFISFPCFAQLSDKDSLHTVASDIQKQIPDFKKWTVIDYLEGYLDNDDIKDAVIILDDNAQENPTRKIMIFWGRPENKYILSDSSDSAIACQMCGGAFGDPYQSVEIKNHHLIINHYGGAGTRWSIEATFAYSRIDKCWELIKTVNTTFSVTAPDEQGLSEKTPKNFGKIKLKDFDISTLQ